MKKIISFLRAIGILRAAGKTYKGKNISGDYATADIDKSRHDESGSRDEGSSGEPTDTGTASSRQANAPTSRLLIVITWILGILLILSGLLVMLVDTASGAITTLLGVMLLNPVSQVIRRWFRPYNRRSFRVFVYFILFILLGYTLDEPVDYGERIGSIDVKQGTASAGYVQDFSLSLAKLLFAYRDARMLEERSLALNYNDLSLSEFKQFINLQKLHWQQVAIFAGKLAQYKRDADNKVSFYTRPQGSFFITSAQAQTVQEKWALVDLVKQAYPQKRRIDIIQAVFQDEANTALKRLQRKNKEAQAAYQDEASYINYKEKWYVAFQNGTKVGMWAAGAPAAISAGGALAATSIFIGGIDAGIAVGETIDVVINDKGTAEWKMVKDKVAPMMLLANVANLFKDPRSWDHDNLLFLSDMAIGETDPDSALVLNVRQDRSGMDIYRKQNPGEGIRSPVRHIDYGNQLMPPDFLMTSDEFYSAEHMQKISEELRKFINNPEKQLAIRQRLAQQQAYFRQLQVEQERKTLAIRKIMARKEQERQEKARKQREMEAQQKLSSQSKVDSGIKQILDALNIKPEQDSASQPTKGSEQDGKVVEAKKTAPVVKESCAEGWYAGPPGCHWGEWDAHHCRCSRIPWK